jgi:hypothetical protein
MSILKVARIGHPVVRTAARAVAKEALGDRLFQKLVDDMPFIKEFEDHVRKDEDES